MTRPSTTTSPFGQHLRHWRARAGLSQLELAAEAGTTPRHLSFVETGRSRPGRDLVLRLAEVLAVPLRERNVMLASAGLGHAFAVWDLEEDSMAPVRRVLDRVLRTHEPYPAWIVASGLRFVRSNAAAERLFPGMCDLPPDAIVDLWYGPGPMRHMVQNWPDVVWAAVSNLRREASGSGDPAISALLRRAEAHLATMPPPEKGAIPELPIICPRLMIGERVVQTIATVMRFDAAIEVTASELRVELMYPADEASEAFFEESGRP